MLNLEDVLFSIILFTESPSILVAGKYVPVLAELIIDKNNNPSLHIDLKGFLVCWQKKII